MTYALLLAKSDLSSIALDQLRNTSTNEEGDFGWQQISLSKASPDWLYEDDAGKHRKEPIMSEYIYFGLDSRTRIGKRSLCFLTTSRYVLLKLYIISLNLCNNTLLATLHFNNAPYVFMIFQVFNCLSNYLFLKSHLYKKLCIHMWNRSYVSNPAAIGIL
jgi:hypothetical protein